MIFGNLKQSNKTKYNQVFLSAHYSGEDLVPKFGVGEQWKKVFGPVFIFLNSQFDGNESDPIVQLWESAKTQVQH